MISGMYQRVHPTDMASYWGLGPDEKKEYELKKQQKLVEKNMQQLEKGPHKQADGNRIVQDVLRVRNFEEALAVWVTYTVLKLYDEEQRVQIISMWLSVAIVSFPSVPFPFSRDVDVDVSASTVLFRR
jgi:hypothetical protein